MLFGRERIPALGAEAVMLDIVAGILAVGDLGKGQVRDVSERVHQIVRELSFLNRQ